MSRHNELQVWVTVEVLAALNEAAERANVGQRRYTQLALWEFMDIPGEIDDYFPDIYCYDPRTKTRRLGGNGRWGQWVRVGCGVLPHTPFRVNSLSEERGYGSMSAFIRAALREALARDLGYCPEMPRDRQPGEVFAFGVRQ